MQAQQMRQPRVLTPYPMGWHPDWLSRVDLFQETKTCSKGNPHLKLRRPFKLLRDLRRAWHLFRQGRHYDAVLTGSDWDGLFFCILQRILRRRSRVPHVFLDFYVNLRGSHAERAVRASLYRLAVQGSSKVIVQRRREAGLYADAFRLPERHFTFLPYHSTAFDVNYEAKDGGYIFAGGDTHRDYPVLIRAVSGLCYRTIIAAARRDHFRGIEIPPNVEIRTASHEEFMQLMAAASVVVVPLQAMPQHVGGEQTYINAMTMGKPTIVTDPDACDYIAHGVTGILTPPGDAEALRVAIVKIMEDPGLAQRIGSAAKAAATRFSPENFFQGVLQVAEECIRSSNAKAPARTHCSPPRSTAIPGCADGLGPQDPAPVRAQAAPSEEQP